MEHDKEQNDFDSTLQRQTSKITKVVSQTNGATGSLNSLILIIGCLGETNKDVVHALRRSKQDISSRRELRELLVDYFRCSHKTIEFLNILREWLHGGSGVSWRLRRVKTALHDFESDKTNMGFGGELLHRALNGFMNSKANDSLAAEQLRAKLQDVLDEQRRFYERLQAKRNEVDVGRIHVYRKVTTIILSSVYMGLLVCVAVTAVLSPPLVVPPLAALAAIAAMNPTDYMKVWMDHLWANYEDRLKKRGELVKALMEDKSGIAVEEMEGIRAGVHDLWDKIQSFPNAAATINLRKDSVVKTVIKDMEKKIDEFAKAVKNLETNIHKCYNDVIDARSKILGTVIQYNQGPQGNGVVQDDMKNKFVYLI